MQDEKLSQIIAHIRPDLPDYQLRARRQELIAAGHSASLVDAALRRIAPADPAHSRRNWLTGAILVLFNFTLAGIAGGWRSDGPAEWIAAFILALGVELLLAFGLYWLAAPAIARLSRPIIYGAGFSLAAAILIGLVRGILA